MAQSTYRKKVKKDASDQFFLYVAFHSAWTAVVNFFHHD
jgi:hypothetical protein